MNPAESSYRLQRFQRLRPAACVLALAALGGCAALPSSGPTAAAVTAAGRGAPGVPGFQIVELTPEAVARLQVASAPAAGLSSLPRAAAGADVILPGDTLQVSIFEVGASLFSTRPSLAFDGAGAPSAAGASLPPVAVGRDGGVSLPYVGRIVAAGLTPDAVAARIQAALVGKSQAPQVMVTVREKLSAAVVMGDVRKPGRVPLTVAGERVLDAVALAGGTLNPAQDEWVHVRRGGAEATASLASLSAGSDDDIVLSPDDRVELIYRPRTFSVFGAAGKVSEYPFQSPRLSLAEAVARAGGPAEQQADPSAVFVFRYDRVGPGFAPAADARPVAYRLDLTQARSYFVAQSFEMAPRDVVYVANAQSNQPAKLLQILNLFFQPFYTVKVLSQN